MPTKQVTHSIPRGRQHDSYEHLYDYLASCLHPSPSSSSPKLLRTPGPSPKDSVPRWSGSGPFASYPTLRISPVGPQEVGNTYRHRAKALQSIQLELKPQTLLLLPPPSKFPRSLGMPRLANASQCFLGFPSKSEKEPNVTELYVYPSKKTSRGTAISHVRRARKVGSSASSKPW